MELAVVVLAAGSGTRMKSKISKVVHKVAGKPMISHVTQTAQALNPQKIIVVVSDNYEQVKSSVGEDVQYCIQKEQLGTAHALLQTKDLFKDFTGNILVLYGDAPLVEVESLEEMLYFHEDTEAAATVITAEAGDPTGYGRIVRSGERIAAIVEEKDANQDQRAIREVNSGMYCFNDKALFEKLLKVKPHNEQSEYYLTDVISMLVDEGAPVETFELPIEEILGVNSRQELAQANLLMYQQIIHKWMSNGVTIIDPLNTYIERDVIIDNDSVIYPQTMIKGSTKIGSSCEIGPSCHIDNAQIGNDCTVGPFSRLRPGTVLADKAKVGSFCEVKNSSVGKGSKVPHLSYIGDTTIEEDVNVGAGTITCNYDGSKKHKTHIKKGAFIGSDTMLVAPVTIGKNAFTGAGSVIGHDVPDEALAIERSDQKNIEDYAGKKKR